MKSKVISHDDVVSSLKDGMSVMYGGFMACGTPSGLVQAILDSGVKDLTIIGNDTAFPDKGIAPLITENRVRKVITSHIGLNPEVGRRMMANEMEVELIPQGTLAERIRSAGAGLGGFLTPTGVGTMVEEGKQRLTVDGRDYLLELPMKADLAILHAHKADTSGNLVYRLSARNFNPLIALAATTVFAEVEEIVEVGALNPDEVMTPAALVDGIVKGASK